jgi:predicted transcriptional regulator
MVAVHRWHRLVGHTAKRMRGLSSPSCFAVGAHGSVSCLLCDRNDCIRRRNPELQILSMPQRVYTVFQWSLRLTSGRWLT